MINRERSLGVVALLTSAVLSACAQVPGEEQSQPLGEASQAIIGGTAVTSSRMQLSARWYITTRM